MAHGALDTSRAKCRECGKPYQPGDALYSTATKIDSDVEPRVMLEFCHAECHVPIERVFGKLRDGIRDIERKLR